MCHFVLYFNSIKVRLERYEEAGINPYFAHFNSIKVRLEHAAAAMLSSRASISIP